MEMNDIKKYTERETYLRGIKVRCTTEEFLRCMIDKNLENEIISRGEIK